MIRARSLRGFVVISSAMARILRERGLAPTNTAMIVAHSPAEPPRAVAPRGQVQTPAHIGYVGSLYPGRGVEVIVEIAARRPGLVFDIFGGSTDDLARWRSASVPPNIVFHGFRPPGQLAEVYGGLDVLLMPYPRSGIYGATQRIDTSAYCSPMKMFEYMASGVPMVASDLPVLQEVLEHERNALIVPAADVDAWCTAIDRLVTVPALRLALAQRALADLADYTPSARVHKILGALGPGPL
jgi:glycosyltransferase involved in cell wall biosynthesis